ncbi:MAG: PilZ domain-containing protein [Rhodospirillales bacterium]|nr:PilZ domain-containing protein [Rhodospirillales bacterium]
MTMAEFYTERREAERFPLMMTAAVAMNGGNMGAVIFDISEGGAKIQLTETPLDPAKDLGIRVTLVVPKYGKLDGEVAWIDEEYFGLKFDDGQSAELTFTLNGLTGN